MPTVDINLIAILAAILVNMFLGFMWYSKSMFGKTWQSLVGLSDKQIKESDQVTPMIAMALLAFVQVLVLLHFVTYAAYFYPEYTNFAVGLYTGIFAWVGFVLPVMGGSYLFARRRKKLLAIDSAYSLVVLLINGVLLSVIR